MTNKIFVVFENNNYEVQKIYKKLNQWIYQTDFRNFTNKDDIKFLIQCSECNNTSIIKEINKKYEIPQIKYLCPNCVKKGNRNPFFNKKHSKGTIDIIKEKTSIASIQLWQDETYREKVVNILKGVSKNNSVNSENGISSEKIKKLWQDSSYREKVIAGISKPRRKSFKEEQSIRMKKWYNENPKQRLIRSDKMKKYWEEGTLSFNRNCNINRSKDEINLFEFLKNDLVGYKVEEKRSIKIDNNWFLPDILIEDKIIVEYFGNYWHGNPRIFKEDDLVAYHQKAKNVWEKDRNRIQKLEKSGYKVIIVWEDEKDKIEGLIQKIKNILT